MVGENTDITGGTFLIEKMPDPSAVWTRGNDKHTEWGGRKMSL
jgi:aminopeptidase YwaD